MLLAYRFFGWRVGPAYRDWVLDDITRPGWLLRQGAPALSSLLLVGAVLTAALDGDAGRLLTVVVVLGLVGATLRTSLRDKALRQQGIDAEGARLPMAGWYDDPQALRRRNLFATVGTVVLVLAGLTVLALRSA